MSALRSSEEHRALVLFSGGQDSTTCLAWALTRFAEVETVGFDYGQRNRIELGCREVIRQMFPMLGLGKGRLGPDHVIPLPALGEISETALTRDIPIERDPSGLPTTFVPGRNLVFITFAACVASQRGCAHLVTGVSQGEGPSYPDCRAATMRAMQQVLDAGMGRPLVLHTPLMNRDKAETFALAEELGGRGLLDLVVERTHTCYLGDRTHRHDWGYGCGACPACVLRAEGWRRWQGARGGKRAQNG